MVELINIMRTFLITIILFFNVQTWTKAEDIRDYEIEGISVGESVLKYFSLNEIEQNKWDYFKNKEFTPLQFDNPSFAKVYDAIDIQYKTNDKDYKIAGLSGIIFYEDKKKIKDCYKKMDDIINDVRSIFSNLNSSEKKTFIHKGIDDGGKSKVRGINFEFENGDVISIQCYNYSKEAGDLNHLRFSMNTYDYRIFLSTKAYK